MIKGPTKPRHRLWNPASESFLVFFLTYLTLWLCLLVYRQKPKVVSSWSCYFIFKVDVSIIRVSIGYFISVERIEFDLQDWVVFTVRTLVISACADYYRFCKHDLSDWFRILLHWRFLFICFWIIVYFELSTIFYLYLQDWRDWIPPRNTQKKARTR